MSSTGTTSRTSPTPTGPENKIGIAQAATLINAMRAERGAANTLTIDAGDTIQGTPLAYYFAKINPISATVKHPMALAMNTIGYDAVGLGNHEFDTASGSCAPGRRQLDFPLLGANVHDAVTGRRAFTPYVLKRIKTDSGWLTVGLVGLVTPGCALWDRDNVQGKLDFNGIVEEAKTVIPQVKAAGADVVIVRATPGRHPGSSYGDALPFPENASTQLAEEVPGIDAILVGHAHLEIPERFVTNKATGKQVLLTEPLKWGMRVSVMDLELAKEQGRWSRHRGAFAPVGRQDRRRRSRRRPGRAGRTRGHGELRQRGHRDLHGAAQHGHRLLGGLRRDRRHQLCPGQHHQGRAGQHSRGRAARPVHCGGLLPCCGRQGRAADHPRCRGAVHLRQHAARHQGHRRAGQGLPGGPRSTSSRSPPPRPGPGRHQRRDGQGPNGTPDYNYDVVYGLERR